jgi:hypothetical protein
MDAAHLHARVTSSAGSAGGAAASLEAVPQATIRVELSVPIVDASRLEDVLRAALDSPQSHTQRGTAAGMSSGSDRDQCLQVLDCFAARLAVQQVVLSPPPAPAESKDVKE